MKNKYLQEAQRIGDQLLKTALQNEEHGIYWKTADLNTSDNSVTWITVESLYTGTSGIALFLLILYQQTNDKKYLKTAEKAMQWVDWYCKSHPSTYYGFITGRLGVSYAYLRFYEITHEKSYLTKAVSLAKKNLDFLKEPY